MADAINLIENTDAIGEGIQNAAAGIGNSLYVVLFIALVVAILGGLLFFIFWWTSFKHKIKIKEIISGDGHFYILEDVAKRKKLNGAEFWKLRRRKAVIPAPPAEALQLTRKGRLYAECAHHEKSGIDAGYSWIIPAQNPLSGNYTVTQTQEERALLADRMRRAQERKSRSTIDIVMQFAGMSFVLIIVISLMAFYGEIAKSTSNAANEIEGALQRAQELTNKQIEFQEQLNVIFSTMTCTPPEEAVDLPLDATTGGGGE